MLETRVRYTVFAARQNYQRGNFAMDLKLSLHHQEVRYSKLVRQNSCDKRYSLFYFRLVTTSV